MATRRASALRRILALPTAWFSGGVVLVLAFAAILGPSLLPEADPFGMGADMLAAPSAANLFGTDDLGQDVFRQVVLGARVSLLIGVCAALAATVLGVAIGAAAGYAGGRFDTLVMRVSEIFQIMPVFVLAAVIVAISGAGQTQVILIIALLSWPQTARLIRGEVLRIRSMDYIAAVRCLGYTEGYILLREVIPNALGSAIAVATLIVAKAILLEAALGFFGLSGPDVVSWGRTLSTGQRFMHQAWWLSAFPGLAIFLTVMSFNLLGDCIGQALAVRQQERH